MIKIPKDPLYEVSDHDRAWFVVLAWIIALAGAMAVWVFMAHGPKTPAPAESPPPALQETRTDIRTGRITCDKWDSRGCAEWGIYRTTGN